MNIFELPVHPAADVFPMLDPDELTDLSTDIIANGLQHPIVVGMVDGVEMLIDGRNRLAACKLAGLTPEVKQMNGADPMMVILTANHRRHMTKGQHAVAAVEATKKDSNLECLWGDTLRLSQATGVPKNRIAQANTIHKYAPEYVESVIAGAKSVDEAYEEAKHRKRAGNDDTEKLDWLKSVAPDLADKVVEGELTLVGAIAEYHERDRIAKASRGATLGTVRTILNSNLFGTDANREALIDALSYDSEASEIIGLSHGEIVKQLSKLQQSITVFLQEI